MLVSFRSIPKHDPLIAHVIIVSVVVEERLVADGERNGARALVMLEPRAASVRDRWAWRDLPRDQVL